MGSEKPRSGIVYYSRTGYSKRLAHRLSKSLDATLQEIRAPAYDNPYFGFGCAGYDSLRERDMPVSHPLPEVADLDLLVLCGPVWTSYPATPLRTFLRADLQHPTTVGLFLTRGSQIPEEKSFEVAAQDLGRPFAAIQSLANSAEGTEQESDTLAKFLADLERSEYEPWPN